MESLCDRILSPRVFVGDSESSVLLVDLLDELLSLDDYQIVQLTGAGKTTAMHYALQWANQNQRRLAIEEVGRSGLEQHIDSTAVRQGQPWQVLLLSSDSPNNADVRLRLANWGRDEFIEYLLKFHPAQCKSVMARIMHTSLDFAEGSPYVWQPMLDAMAASPDLHDPSEFVLQQMQHEVTGRQTLPALTDEILSRPTVRERVIQENSALTARAKRWLQLADVREALMADRLAERIAGCYRWALKRYISTRMLDEIAKRLSATDLRLVRFLERCATKSRYSAMAVSLLVRMQPEWRPSSRKQVDLSGADLGKVAWSGCQLRRVRLINARLTEANLSGADVTCAVLHNTQLRQVNLHETMLSQATGHDVSFRHADLSLVIARECKFSRADFERANLSYGSFVDSRFEHTRMRGTNLTHANFDKCTFYEVDFEQADFESATFHQAWFARSELKLARLRGARFRQAIFHNADLEAMDLSECDFAEARLGNALLTDTIAQGSCFRNAEMRGAGLAGILWADCDLRNSDLRGAAFHMGSTRCGLVDSPYPSHGTRTGFYTDDYVDLNYKQPEQIRKAALVGCDLRGALLSGCDFYLVDVRDCLLDPWQREQMAASGAILD
ncbi:MAG: pentapeptide repeat-containing protein [Pirellulaceae bacterium]|nr:pentapeptide repeat-containing protein [Pirellulaceae bacterium]